METVFGSAFAFMVAAGVLAHAVNSDILKRPPNNIPLMLSCSIATFAAIPFLIWGFFAFNWKVPVISFALSLVAVPMLYSLFLRTPRAAGFAILMAIAGLCLGAYCILAH